MAKIPLRGLQTDDDGNVFADSDSPIGQQISRMGGGQAGAGNWLQALIGGMNTVGGVIRGFRLSDAMADAKSKREAADKLQAEAVLLTADTVDFTKADAVKAAFKKINEVNAAQQDAAVARARVDKIQNQQAIYQALQGVGEIGVGLGYGASQGSPMAGLGGGGGAFLPAALGVGGGLLGALAFSRSSSTVDEDV